MGCYCGLNSKILISCFIGLVLSIYSLYVETKAEHENDYQAMCDISERISCSKVFTSKYGRGFGIIGPIFGQDSPLNVPNGLIGIFFYVTLGFLTFTKSLGLAKVQIGLAATSVVMSLYLAYLLYFVLEDFCVVCVSTYGVNIFNFIYAVKRFKLLAQEKNGKKIE